MRCGRSPVAPAWLNVLSGRHRATLTGLCLAGSGAHGTAPTQHVLRLCRHEQVRTLSPEVNVRLTTGRSSGLARRICCSIEEETCPVVCLRCAGQCLRFWLFCRGMRRQHHRRAQVGNRCGSCISS
ncbi:hypothetical protein NSND_63264 [Nitrospira sp. ND1]|nr:hypothetical protein NSND_63264 [Nitrospira sp. ND1]